MKHSFIFILLTTFLLFASCKTLTPHSYSLNDYVAAEISKIENIESYSDETIKTLSIIYRTNLKYKDDLNLSKINDKILSLTKETNNLILSKQISINTNPKIWTEIINKSHILEFCKQNNINLANISDIQIIEDKNHNATTLNIASKEINFDKFALYFKIPSNKNISIENNTSFIKITGYGNQHNFEFDISYIEELAAKNYNYNKIFDIFGYDLIVSTSKNL